MYWIKCDAALKTCNALNHIVICDVYSININSIRRAFYRLFIFTLHITVYITYDLEYLFINKVRT